MQATLALAVYTPFAIITAVVLALELLRGFKRHEDYLFTVLCLCIALWFASDIASLLVADFAVLRFLYNFKLIFVGYIPPVLLLFVLRFYKVSLGARRRAVLWLLFTVPTLNIVFVFTSGLHNWMVDLALTALTPYREFSILWGPWFWVHTVQSYIVSVVIISTVIVRHFRLPRFYRLPSTLMAVGIFITLLGNVITLLQLFPPIIDPTLITCSLSMILFDLAIINNNRSKFVRFSHKRIYHYLDEYILILDETQRILEWNHPAGEWFRSQGVALKDALLPDVVAALLRQPDAAQRASQDAPGTNLYLLGGDFPVVLNLRVHRITDAKDDAIGSIAVFTDITRTWALIEQLEKKAEVDSLTGIPNHRAYIGAKARLDIPERLPLSVLVCDANDLKAVNDTHGHRYGDQMIRSVAAVLEQVFAAPHFVARTGGDEFVCLLPGTAAESAHRLAERVNAQLASHGQYPFPVTVAVGIATKTRPDERLDDLLALADSRMYQNKQRMKRHPPANR